MGMSKRSGDERPRNKDHSDLRAVLFISTEDQPLDNKEDLSFALLAYIGITSNLLLHHILCGFFAGTALRNLIWRL